MLSASEGASPPGTPTMALPLTRWGPHRSPDPSPTYHLVPSYATVLKLSGIYSLSQFWQNCLGSLTFLPPTSFFSLII